MLGEVRTRNPFVLAFTLWLTSCAQAPGISTNLPTVSIAPSDETSYQTVEAPLPTPPQEQGNAPYSETLTLHRAIQRALNYSPALKAARLEIGAKRGEALQAGLRPNPEVALTAEDVGPDDLGEYTLEFAQAFDLGGKRVTRLRAAQLDTSVAWWEYEAARVQVATQAAQTFVDVLASQERLKVLRDSVDVADRTKQAVAARVKAGSASPIELDRAEVSVARAKAAVEAEEARLEGAKRRLATLWGSNTPNFGDAEGELAKARTVPELGQVESYIERNPALAKWASEISRRYAVLEVERAKRVPDLKLSAGVRQLEEVDSPSLVASVSIPLQVFDRNQGAIAAAQTRVAKAEQEAQAAQSELVSSLAGVLSDLEVAAAQLHSIEQNVLPATETAFERTRTGYAEGKFDLLSLLDAQRLVFEARLDLVNAKADFEKAKVRVEAIIGQSLSELR
jgi:outer membrane protein, heavy metal efflux system